MNLLQSGKQDSLGIHDREPVPINKAGRNADLGYGDDEGYESSVKEPEEHGYVEAYGTEESDYRYPQI